MTIIEFLDLPAKDKKQYCVKHGIKAHYDMSSIGFDTLNCIDAFCSKLDLEKGDITRVSMTSYGSYCKVYFGFKFDFQSHADDTLLRGSGDELIMHVYGASANTLRIGNASFERDIYIWNQINDFFDDRPDYNNFDFYITATERKTVSAAIEDARKLANDIFPHIEFCLNSLKDNSYVEAYNAINMHKFVIGNTIMPAMYFPPLIYIRYNVQKIYGITMDILESLLMAKYVEAHSVNWMYFPQNLKINEILDTYKKTYVIDNAGADNKKKLEDANKEYIEGVENLVKEISKKYGIHESYFCGQCMCHVLNPTMLNNVDLSKPLIRK